MSIMLTDDVLEYIDRSVLCWLATVDPEACPNVSPKEIFAAFDQQTLVIANIASPVSISNIRANPKVCVSFIDVFSQKGYKLLGVAEVVERGDPRFPTFEAPLFDITKGAFRILSIIAVQVSKVEPIVAPSYRLVPGTTEASQIESAMRTYGVSPRKMQ
ncbi:MAG TPA: pyridoxamine 5'-phosphate oxidase family protein [Noviherbaspirillum sp.]|nr:pyridoxamine 5'-phosphate oxidase family protein [Noviherbaspirillum sp.]